MGYLKAYHVIAKLCSVPKAFLFFCRFIIIIIIVVVVFAPLPFRFIYVLVCVPLFSMSLIYVIDTFWQYCVNC